MPGKRLSDFEPGQWVAFSDSKWNGMNGGRPKAKYNRIVQVTKTYETYVQVVGWTKDDITQTGGFMPTSLLTAEETEDQLYCCSYCGKEGHNRRTCPEANGITEVGVEKEYIPSGMDPMDLKKGDLFMVEHDSLRMQEYTKMVYEFEEKSSSYYECKIVDRMQPTFTFRQACSFNPDWKIIPVTEKTAPGAFKELPLWELIELVLPKSRLTLLYGPPGTGKTTIANNFGSPRYVSNITVTEETPAAELRGHFIPKGQEFVWMDGPALTEFTRGGRLVINEIDKASGDALTFCHALLDDPGIASITLPYKDEFGHPVTVKPHPDFHVVATMNGEPEDLPDALRDRFAVRMHVNKVHPDAIKALPKELRKIAAKGVSTDGERSVSIRGWNAFVALREHIGEENAAMAVFGPRAKTILNTIKIDSIGAKK